MGSMTKSGSPGTDPRKQRNERILQQLNDSRRKESPVFCDDTNIFSPPFQTSQGQMGSTSSSSSSGDRHNSISAGNKIDFIKHENGK